MDLSQQALQTNAFSKFLIIFQIIGWKPENIQTNSEAWILTKVQCIIYQLIWFDKLYKLMESFFKFQNHFLNKLQFFK